MSDPTRKRCRKSKLVPRECDLLDVEEIKLEPPEEELLVPVKKSRQTTVQKKVEIKSEIEKECDKGVLKRINAAVRQSLEIPEPLPALEKPSRTFEVAIQVETCDEDMNSVLKFDDYKTKLRNLLNNLDVTLFPSIELKAENILKATDDVLKSSINIVDKSLCMYVRNTIGQFVKEDVSLTYHEDLIQRALEQWKIWSRQSINRTPPIFYKCYVCKLSWWHLSEFRNHVVNHNHILIRLERKNANETNIVASYCKKSLFEEIYTEGKCPLCGKDFNHHKIRKDTNILQKSNGCGFQFNTCFFMMRHLAGCDLCSTESDNFKCSICSIKFEDQGQLDEHLVLCHSVRSDVPINTGCKKCKCSVQYVSDTHHVCKEKPPRYQCSHCSMSFYNKPLMRWHSETLYQPGTCEICNQDLYKSCIRYKHMLKHTDQFIMVDKCAQCPGLHVFVDEDDAYSHKRLKHEHQDEKKQVFFPKMLVPISCVVDVLKLLPVSVIKQEVVDPQDYSVENYDGELKSVKIENVFVKEEPEDVDDDDESKLIIKEEPIDYNESYTFDDSIPENDISIKEENFDEKYEGDIIKINPNFEQPNEFDIKKNDTNENNMSVDESDDENHQAVLIGGRMKNRIYKCKKCGYRARHKKFKEHVESVCGSSPFNKKTYQCTECDLSFPSLGKYLMHFSNHGFKALCCPVCFRQFPTHTQLGVHVYSHVKKNFVRVKLISFDSRPKSDYQCKQCSEIVQTSNFFDHWQTHLSHKPDDKARSLEELRRKVLADALPDAAPVPGCLPNDAVKECLQHILMKVPKECNFCHKKFDRVYGCKRHIIEHLLVDAFAQKPVFGALRCQLCAEGFPTPEKYKQHMRDHASLPVYKCELCEKTFSDSSNFTKHKKVHNYKVVVCDICGKKFQTKASLVKHFVKHEVTAPITCSLCNRVFHFETSYRRHVRYTHEKTAAGFRCLICSERFDCLKSKWDHMWEVHKERKQKADCPICFASFRKYADVKVHARDVHNMDVTVISMKNASSNLNLGSYFDTPKVRLGETETLVVYESE